MPAMARNYDPSDLTLYVAHLVEERRETGESYDSIAASWNTTKPHVSNIYNHLRGVGPELEAKLAAVLAGKSRDRLAGMASDWKSANPDWMPRPIRERSTAPKDDPDLTMVLGYHANRGRWSELAQAAARGMQHMVSLTQEEWVGMLDALDRAIRDHLPSRATAKVSQEKPVGGVGPQETQNRSGSRKRWTPEELAAVEIPEEVPAPSARKRQRQ